MNTVLKLAMTAAVAVAATTTAFAQPEQNSFERDGYKYVYSVVDHGASRRIEGKYYPGGREFTLNVRNGRVSGVMNSSAVSFPLAEAATSAGPLASAN